MSAWHPLDTIMGVPFHAISFRSNKHMVLSDSLPFCSKATLCQQRNIYISIARRSYLAGTLAVSTAVVLLGLHMHYWDSTRCLERMPAAQIAPRLSASVFSVQAWRHMYCPICSVSHLLCSSPLRYSEQCMTISSFPFLSGPCTYIHRVGGMHSKTLKCDSLLRRICPTALGCGNRSFGSDGDILACYCTERHPLNFCAISAFEDTTFEFLLTGATYCQHIRLG